jgi:hypothetical protein
VARLLAKSPGDRYESIDHLRRDLLAVDLGDEAKPRLLILPRASRRSSSDTDPPAPAGAPASATQTEPGAAAQRYRYETWIGKTEISQLSRALDASLDRSVIIERFALDLIDEATERRLLVLARGAGPFIQRALSFDRKEKVAVFEAPAGSPLGELGASGPTSRQLVRLMMGIALAVAPIHDMGSAHGALTGASIVVDEGMTPTVLISGLGAAPSGATAKADIAAVLDLIARFAGCPPRFDALVGAIAPLLSHPEKAAILVSGDPATGSKLYAFGEALEIALLKAQRRGVS